MEDALGPASIPVWRQLEDRAAAVEAAAGASAPALLGGTVEISGGVEDQAGCRVSSVGLSERMEDTLSPASICVRRELENRAQSVGATDQRRAVEISGCVEDQASKG